MSVGFHDMPNNRAIADWHHRLGPILGLLAKTRALAAAENNDFHLFISNGDTIFLIGNTKTTTTAQSIKNFQRARIILVFF